MIVAVRLPHGQFKSAEQHFMPALQFVSWGNRAVSNLRALRRAAGAGNRKRFCDFHRRLVSGRWRIFVRIRVVVNLEGAPETTTELITTQKVGFSGVSD